MAEEGLMLDECDSAADQSRWRAEPEPWGRRGVRDDPGPAARVEEGKEGTEVPLTEREHKLHEVTQPFPRQTALTEKCTLKLMCPRHSPVAAAESWGPAPHFTPYGKASDSEPRGACCLYTVLTGSFQSTLLWTFFLQWRVPEVGRAGFAFQKLTLQAVCPTKQRYWHYFPSFSVRNNYNKTTMVLWVCVCMSYHSPPTIYIRVA